MKRYFCKRVRPFFFLFALLFCGWRNGTLISPAYYVSTSGLDTNAGTFSQPFLTLGKCQTAMRTGYRTCYVRGGSYSWSAGLTLAYADNNDSFIAYPNETPVIDGGSSVTIAFTINGGASGITLNGLTIQHIVNTGVDVIGANMTFVNLTIQNLTSSSTGMGCIYSHYQISNELISHNLCQNNTGPGIVLAFGGGNPEGAGYIADSNKILNVNST